MRTAVSEAEVLARLAEGPAAMVLADTAVTRPDSVRFARRVLARAPHATLVLFGPEDPTVAAAAVAAGARGVLRGADQDLVSVVAKALLLLLPADLPASLPLGTALPPARPSPARPSPAGKPAVAPAAKATPSGDGQPHSETGNGDGANSIVPAQRGMVPQRRVALTERELQVLRAMADGKSNSEIGRELFVSEDTVKTHARRLFRKLGARDRAHAVAAGFRAGILA